MHVVARFARAHRRLPIVLRAWFLAPFTILLVFLGGIFLTLPPGPLCDEGMVLFMEGGCDWGVSNEFFFSKLALLLGLNLAFVVGWRYGVREWRGFAPHFAVLAALTVLNDSDEYCRNYYSHPNGSIGQMTLEGMAFAALGVAILSKSPVRSWKRLAVVTAAWNGLNVSVFYAGLAFTNHWTWWHTVWIAAVLAIASCAVVLCPPITAERVARDGLGM